MAFCPLALGTTIATAQKPRIVVTTDINIGHGDPSDRQTLAYLLLHLDKLDLRAVVADRSAENVGALEACHLAIDAYEKDYVAAGVRLKELGFPAAAELRSKITPGGAEGAQVIIDEARRDDPRPLYVLAWGNLLVLEHALFRAPDILPKLRVISIETWSNPKKPNEKYLWNSPGRDDLFRSTHYQQLWWLEIDNVGMLKQGLAWAPKASPEADPVPTGGEPYELLEHIARHGALGRHLRDVTDGVVWARYFKVTDIPTLFYLLDPSGNPEDPSRPSWMGRFERPFPKTRPNHWTEYTYGLIDHENPHRTASSEYEVWKRRMDEVTATGRPKAYAAFRDQLSRIYGQR